MAHGPVTSARAPLRIAFLIPALDISGAERMVVRLASGLDARGFDSVVAAFVSGTRLLEPHLRGAGVRFCAIGDTRDSRVSLFYSLAKWLRRERPHILLTFMFHANMAGRLAKRLGLVPAVVCSERIVGWESPARIWLNRMTVRSADAITTNSFAGARFWSERLRIPVQAIHVIYNGVDLQEFVPPVQPAHTPTIAVLAQLHRRNGHDWLIDALKQLHRTVAAPWNCVFAGIGPEESRLRAAVSNAGLDNRVRFAGHCADAPQFYQSAAIAVHPALVSGMPNAVIEAMASGLPVVATAVGGTPEVVEHRRTGFLVEPGDARTTAEYLAWLVTNPEARAEMGHAGRRRAEEQFSIDIAVAHTERVLTDLAARKGLATQDSEAGTILRTI